MGSRDKMDREGGWRPLALAPRSDGQLKWKQEAILRAQGRRLRVPDRPPTRQDKPSYRDGRSGVGSITTPAVVSPTRQGTYIRRDCRTRTPLTVGGTVPAHRVVPTRSEPRAGCGRRTKRRIDASDRMRGHHQSVSASAARTLSYEDSGSPRTAR